MVRTERLKKIIDFIEEDKFVSPIKLAEKMKVSLVTIRRDLKTLAEQGFIIKEYNLIKIARDYDKRFYERHNLNLVQKQIIAELTQRFVQPGDTLFLDTSTTCYEFARLLSHSSNNIHIITNNLYTAIELINNFKIDVILVGGNTRHGYFSTVGPLAENMLANIKVDKFFFSCTMLDKKGIYESNILEGNIKLKMLENSSLHYLLVDSSKFGKASIFKTADIENLDVIISDKLPSKEYLDKLKGGNVEIITPSKDKGSNNT